MSLVPQTTPPGPWAPYCGMPGISLSPGHRACPEVTSFQCPVATANIKSFIGLMLASSFLKTDRDREAFRQRKVPRSCSVGRNILVSKRNLREKWAFF